jgi:hypothetical protein
LLLLLLQDSQQVQAGELAAAAAVQAYSQAEALVLARVASAATAAAAAMQGCNLHVTMQGIQQA